MDVHGCTKSCEDVNCSLAVCAACCSRCDERKEENRGSVWMKQTFCQSKSEALSYADRASDFCFRMYLCCFTKRVDHWKWE